MPAAFVNWYKILQVDPEADQDVIRAAHHRLALKYHPDTSTHPDATTRMAQINAAWEVLGDPKRREAFDLELQSRSRGSSGSGPRPSANPTGSGPTRPRPGPTPGSSGGPGPTGGSATGGTGPPDPPSDRPILAITPPEIELWTRQGEEYAKFTVSVTQVGGPAWVQGRHILGVSFEPPWRRDMFSKAMISGVEPPFLIDFEIKLATLEAAHDYAGQVQVEVRVVTIS
jgi:hypothetical protein